MRPSTLQKLQRAAALLAEREDSYMFAELPPGGPETGTAGWDALPADLRELLSFSNAPRAGAIALLKDTRIPANQFCLDSPEVQEKLGGADRWLVFGACFDFPLLLRRDSGAVWHFPDLGKEHFEESDFRMLTAGLDEFVVDCLLGTRYLEITGIADRWWEFAVESGLAENRDAP